MISFGVIHQDTVNYDGEITLPIGGRVALPNIEVRATITVYWYDDDSVAMDFEDIQFPSADERPMWTGWEWQSIDLADVKGRELWAAAENALRAQQDNILSLTDMANGLPDARQQERAERFGMQRSEW